MHFVPGNPFQGSSPDDIAVVAWRYRFPRWIVRRGQLCNLAQNKPKYSTIPLNTVLALSAVPIVPPELVEAPRLHLGSLEQIPNPGSGHCNVGRIGS